MKAGEEQLMKEVVESISREDNGVCGDPQL